MFPLWWGYVQVLNNHPPIQKKTSFLCISAFEVHALVLGYIWFIYLSNEMITMQWTLRCTPRLPFQGKIYCPSYWEHCSSQPCCQSLLELPQVQRAPHPVFILLPERDGCRSIKAWPPRHNSEHSETPAPQGGRERLPLGLHPSGISPSAQSCFLPSSPSQVIPRALLNKFPVHWTQSHSLFPGENQPTKYNLWRYSYFYKGKLKQRIPVDYVQQ